MRESEILGLLRRYVHLSEAGITLPAEITKTKDDSRFVPLVSQALVRRGLRSTHLLALAASDGS
jgi:hypothetical protein